MCYHSPMAVSAEPAAGAIPVRGDRRARRRQETIEEILDIAVDVIDEEGVNALSLSEVARRLGVQPPSLYKYFDSLLAVYDALFERGQRAHLEAIRAAMTAASPGLAALEASQIASCRWGIENRGLVQLMFWRPVPKFGPSPAAFAPSEEMFALLRAALDTAVDLGQLGPAAASDEGVYVVSTMVSGVTGQAIANEPDVPWGEGRFEPILPKLL